ncbi:MAG TPA: ABC transporter substrate-binding protein [Thermoanaerobacterales bacterium]|nr:ABC transporter substrate-binding protein [Thermoanaerobacterales bacterium]
MKKRKTLLLITIILISILLSSCGVKKEQANTRKITVLLDWEPNTNHTGLYVAKDKGFFEKEGLEVEIIQSSEGGTSQLIAASQGDFGISYQEEVTHARAMDIPVISVAAIIQNNTSGLASLAEKGIKTPKDFEGKRYGGWGSPAEIALLKAMMEPYNADIDKVEIINIGTADFFTCVEKDIIDLYMIYYGWTGVEAELRNIDLNYIPMIKDNPALNFYTPIIIVKETLVKEDPELIRGFLNATSKGYEYCINEPEKASEILLKNVPELNKELVIASQNYLAKEYKGDSEIWGTMEFKRWDNYARWMYENDLIPKKIKADDAFTNEFLEKE